MKRFLIYGMSGHEGVTLHIVHCIREHFGIGAFIMILEDGPAMRWRSAIRNLRRHCVTIHYDGNWPDDLSNFDMRINTRPDIYADDVIFPDEFASMERFKNCAIAQRIRENWCDMMHLRLSAVVELERDIVDRMESNGGNLHEALRESIKSFYVFAKEPFSLMSPIANLLGKLGVGKR